MKLYAVIVDNLGTRKSFAARADNPAAAARQVLDEENGPRYFEQLNVYMLQELAGTPKDGEQISVSDKGDDDRKHRANGPSCGRIGTEVLDPCTFGVHRIRTGCA